MFRRRCSDHLFRWFILFTSYRKIKTKWITSSYVKNHWVRGKLFAYANNFNCLDLVTVRIRQIIIILRSWKVDLEVNVDKSKYLVFKVNRFRTPQCSLTSKGKNLIQVSAFKYLEFLLKKIIRYSTKWYLQTETKFLAVV